MSQNIIEQVIAQCSERGFTYETINPNHHVSWGNSKLAKDGIASFNLPPVSTCPSKGACALWCYATQGNQWMKHGFLRRVGGFKATLDENFVPLMVAELISQKVKRHRIHDSGDFYSPEYFVSWFAIAKALPNIKFYAYTKQIILFQRFHKLGLIPDNLNIIQSLGGKFDHLIDETLPHAKIFHSLDELLAAGYVDTSESDLPAIDKNNVRIGLVVHGNKKGKFKGV